DSGRRVLTIVFALAVPMIIVIPWTQIALLGVDRIPVVASPWFLFTLAAMAFELSREIIAGARTGQQVSTLRGELVHVGRVTALGELASALAHELAQPLTAIRCNVETAEVCLSAANPDVAELRTIVTEISRSDLRAGELIDRMRALIKRR